MLSMKSKGYARGALLVRGAATWLAGACAKPAVLDENYDVVRRLWAQRRSAQRRSTPE
jgi:hypothetical protein